MGFPLPWCSYRFATSFLGFLFVVRFDGTEGNRLDFAPSFLGLLDGKRFFFRLFYGRFFGLVLECMHHFGPSFLGFLDVARFELLHGLGGIDWMLDFSPNFLGYLVDFRLHRLLHGRGGIEQSLHCSPSFLGFVLEVCLHRLLHGRGGI